MKKQLLNVLEYILHFFTRLVLLRHQPKIIAITGSAGKTTAKYTIGSVLQSGFGKDKVRVGFGNLGTAAGVPLAVLGFKTKEVNAGSWLYILPFFIFKAIFSFFDFNFPKYLVLEAAADKPGDIAKTARLLNPLVAVVTNIGEAHLEYFGSLDSLAKDKGALVSAVPKNGLVVLCEDNKYAAILKSQAKASVREIKTESADFAQSAAKAIGAWLGIKSDKIEQGLKSVSLPKGRADIYPGINGSTVIDCSYNANPVSMAYELEKLKNLPKGKGRKIAVLGDMLELGKDGPSLHRKIGEKAKLAADYVIVVGELFRAAPADFYASSIKEAASHLLNLTAPGDTILLKASRGMHLEKLAAVLKRKG